MYDLSGLEDAIAGTSFTGNLRFSASTGSTNTDALDAARAGAPHGAVFLADEQQAGRGRGNHHWHSARGQGLYVSVLLRPAFSAARLPLLPLVAGLAAADAIRAASGLTTDLRWPNDLLIGERKTGGILVESKTDGSSVAFAVVGIGINVHQDAFDPELATPATSLDIAAGRTISRQTVLIALLKSLERESVQLLQADAGQTIPARVSQASTWIRGRRVTIHGPQACTGVTAGLDEDGFLRVATADGIVTVHTGGMRAAETG